MLYLGHFSFVHFENDDKDASVSEHGDFTCLAEADDLDTALDKFADLIDQLRDQTDAFAGVREVFLEDCTEVAVMPEAGLIAHLESQEGEPAPAVTMSLPVTASDDCQAYGFGGLGEEEEGETDDAEPFMRFT